MSEQIIEVLDKLSDKAGIAINWSSDNILPTLQRIGSNLVKYELITSIVWIVISIIIILFLFMIYWNRNATVDGECSTGLDGTDILCIIIAIIFSICITVQIFDIIRCIVFPERIVIDYILYLLNMYR